MQTMQPSLVKLFAPALFGIEMVLPLAAHQNLAGFSYLEALEICFITFHNSKRIAQMNMANLHESEALVICVYSSSIRVHSSMPFL